MPRRRSRSLVPLDSEIERTISTLRRARSESVRASVEREISSSPQSARERVEPTSNPPMANGNENVPLKELGTPGAFQTSCGIRPPTTEANDFEIRPALITLIKSHPFCGNKHESPHNHLKEF